MNDTSLVYVRHVLKTPKLKAMTPLDPPRQIGAKKLPREDGAGTGCSRHCRSSRVQAGAAGQATHTVSGIGPQCQCSGLALPSSPAPHLTLSHCPHHTKTWSSVPISLPLWDEVLEC